MDYSRLEAIENRYDEVTNMISDPSVISNQDLYRKLMKEHSDLEPIVIKYKEHKDTEKSIEEAREMLNESLDDDFRALVHDEFETSKKKLEEINEELRKLLLPKDPNDEKNVIIEIRGGAGGEEAALFSYVLFRMYMKYAERNRWKTEILDSNETEIGGFKEVVFSIEGQGAYSRLKYESGVHRVQRVPETEASGRVHTSTVTVAVLPEISEVDHVVEINPADLEIDTYRASGAGGQHINKTDSAIRITHKPSGIVVSCQEERSQFKNRDKAMNMLRSKLYDIALREQNDAISKERRSQVGTGDRSERIRTYNYPQGRVTDHRIGLTLYKIAEIVDGDLDEIINALITADQAEKLSSSSDDEE